MSVSRSTVLSTYRRLLRLHRRLPREMRDVGDVFLRQEFKRHKNATDDQAKKFILEWTDYARDLEKQLETGAGEAEGSVAAQDEVEVGRKLSSDNLKLLGDDQVVQLYELKKETSKPLDKTK